MHATTLLAELRARGLRLRVDGETLLVRPRRLLTDADRAELRVNKPALRVLLAAEAAAPDAPLQLDEDAAVAAVLAVFPGARVVVESQPAEWPPARGWIPRALAPLNPYTAEPPTVPCPTCGSSDYHRAGSGWTCSRCHPAPAARVKGEED